MSDPSPVALQDDLITSALERLSEKDGRGGERPQDQAGERGEAFHREALDAGDVLRRCARSDAGGETGREACPVMAAVASGARIKPASAARRSTARRSMRRRAPPLRQEPVARPAARLAP
jgi:hypothetical protein